MKIKIVTCKAGTAEKLDGVGLGNQIWWIPAIRQLQEDGHYVYTDSEFLHVIGVCPYNVIRPDCIYVPAWPSPWDVLNIRAANWFANIQGIRYRVKGRDCGFLYDHSVAVDTNKSELETVNKLVPNNQRFYLPGLEPISKKVILGTSNKMKCNYMYWDDLEFVLKTMGFTVSRLGELGTMYDNYRDLFNEMCSGEFYFGVDSGLMHLADVLGMPGIVFWGNTSIDRNAPINKLKAIHSSLVQYPTSDVVKHLLKIGEYGDGMNDITV